MLIVCNYHYIRENFDQPYPSIYGVTPAQFEKQLELLRKLGEFISPNELHDAITNKKILKGTHFLITFDDGLKEQINLALPILEKKNIPAQFFINTVNFTEKKVSLVHQNHLVRAYTSPSEIFERVRNYSKLEHIDIDLTEKEIQKALKHYNYDTREVALMKYTLNFKLTTTQQEDIISKLFSQRYTDIPELVKDLYMDADDWKKLAKSDFLGSHAHHHIPLGLQNKATIHYELEASRDILKEHTGKSPSAISYPYGSYESCQPPVPEIAKSAGYTYGFTMERASNDTLDAPLTFARMDCNDLPGGKNYHGKLTKKDLIKHIAKRSWF